MQTYKIGSGPDCWDFNQAYEAMQDGDTLEFEYGAKFNLSEPFTISKNIHLTGWYHAKEDASKAFDTAIKGNLIVDGVKVSISNLWFEPMDDYAALTVANGGEVDLDNCYFDFPTESTKYGIYVTSRAYLRMNEVELRSPGTRDYTRLIGVKENAHVLITRSNFAWLYVENATVTVLDSTMRGIDDNNTLNITNSSVNLRQVRVHGTQSSRKRPAVDAVNSYLHFTACEFIQPDYAAAVYLTKNTIMTAEQTQFDSLRVLDSRAILHDTVINEILKVENDSYCKAEGNLDLRGRNAELIDVFVSLQSTLITEQIKFNRASQPNVRIANHAFLGIGTIEYGAGDFGELEFEKDRDSRLEIGHSE